MQHHKAFLETSVVDPDSMNPDPAFQVNPDPVTEQKFKKKFS